MAAPRTSARMTMPAPPPAGVSSTARCRPIPNSRMPTASSAHRPWLSASPASDAASGPGNSSGNSVSTVARQGRRIVDVSASVKVSALARRSLSQERLGCPLDNDEVDGGGALSQLLGGRVLRRGGIGLGGLEACKLDDDVAGHTLALDGLG